MGTGPRVARPSSGPLTGSARRRRWRADAFTGGGADGNERLTGAAGVILIVLLAVLGVTILRIRQLISVHLFVGLLLIGPVVLKMASTGYRFVRYYAHDRVYRRKGPPELWLRLIAPVVVLSTFVVFVSGIILLFQGPRGRGQLLVIHRASFFLWLAFIAFHVLGHLPATVSVWGGRRRANVEPPLLERGQAGRRLALAGALVGGVVLALVLIPDFAVWTHGAFAHSHGDH